MEKFLMLAISILLFATVCQAQMTEKGLLEKYSSQQHVKPDDNKIGFSIESISKEKENSYLIKWKCSSDIIMKNVRNHALIAVYLYFIDPYDQSNTKIGLASEFRTNAGEPLGTMDKMIVTLDKPATSLVIYYEGISESIPNSDKFRTAPLFFMASLGDNPKLLDKEPRYAGDLFKQAVEHSKKKDKK